MGSNFRLLLPAKAGPGRHWGGSSDWIPDTYYMADGDRALGFGTAWACGEYVGNNSADESVPSLPLKCHNRFNRLSIQPTSRRPRGLSGVTLSCSSLNKHVCQAGGGRKSRLSKQCWGSPALLPAPSALSLLIWPVVGHLVEA